MLERITSYLTENLDVSADQITIDSDFSKDLGLDSLDLVEMVMALEEEYDVVLPEDMLAGIATIGDVIDILKKLGVEE